MKKLHINRTFRKNPDKGMRNERIPARRKQLNANPAMALFKKYTARGCAAR